MYVYTHAYMHVFVYIYAYIHIIDIYQRTRIYANTCVYIYICIYIYMCNPPPSPRWIYLLLVGGYFGDGMQLFYLECPMRLDQYQLTLSKEILFKI